MVEPVFFVFFFIQFNVPFNINLLIYEQIGRWGERKYPGKTTWQHPQAEHGLSHIGQCGARTYTSHSGEMIE